MNLDGPVHHALAYALHVHHHIRGPKGDYIGLGAAAAAGWAGLPGPGEAALIAAAVIAAHHHLDIFAVLVVAWAGATVGGVAGWLVGLRAGRAVVSARGPFQRARLSALERGERFFERFGVVAVFFTPSWVAGIYGMRAGPYLVANALAALLWAVGLGLGAFFAGPPVIELVGDLGRVTGAVVVGAIVVGVVSALVHRSRR